MKKNSNVIVPVVNARHNLYLIRTNGTDNKSYIKLGYTSNMKKRIYTYYHHNPSTVVVKTWYIKEAKELEKHIHNILPSILGNEWYKQHFIDVIDDIISTASSQTITNYQECLDDGAKCMDICITYMQIPFTKYIKYNNNKE